MQYRFYGDELQLIKYHVLVKFTQKIDPETGQEIEANQTYSLPAVTDDEKNQLLQRYPDAEVSTVDNTGCEWLDGMIFTQEQLQAGELEKAIELGQQKYMEYAMSVDPAAQMLDLDYRVSLLELGVNVNDISAL